LGFPVFAKITSMYELNPLQYHGFLYHGLDKETFSTLY
jgi:hypothetical protein